MLEESSTQGLSPEERGWLHSRLQARLGGAGMENYVEQMEQELDTLLGELLKRRESQAPQATDKWSDPKRRVVITGLGVISALAHNVADYWDGIVNGRSAISLIETYDTEQFKSKIAAEIKNWDPTPWITEREWKRMSRASQFIVAAAKQALEDSKFPIPEGGSEELGVLIGSGTTAFPETENEIRIMWSKGARKVNPFFVPMVLPNMPAGQLGMQFGARGWNAAITSACSASTTAIGEGAELIRRGDVVAMLVGGTEAPIAEISMAGFNNLRALSNRNDDPQAASRPFDKDRDGMVAGEGAAILVIERLDHALARGAHIYAEVLGLGGSCDAYHLVAPDPTGRGGMIALNKALENSGVRPEDIDYINAHGTSTGHNDPMETKVIKGVFGDEAYKVAISGTKSMTGHSLAACGAFEGLITTLALHDGIIPPTINLNNPDPQCDLDYTPLEARKADLRVAVSQSFGFGGQNAAVVLKRWDGE